MYSCLVIKAEVEEYLFLREGVMEIEFVLSIREALFEELIPHLMLDYKEKPGRWRRGQNVFPVEEMA